MLRFGWSPTLLKSIAFVLLVRRSGNYKSTNRFAFLSDDDAEDDNAENSDSVN